MVDILVSALLIVGTLFIALSAVGVVRLPDVYSRLHAITKASTLGMVGILAASLVFFARRDVNVLGEIMAIVFVLLTNPVGGHMIARSAYLVGIRMTDRSVLDELAAAGKYAGGTHDTD